MSMSVQGQGKIRRVGNGLCLPLPTRDLREEGIKNGDLVDYVVFRVRKRDPRSFGMARKLLRGVDLQALMDEDREGANA